MTISLDGQLVDVLISGKLDEETARQKGFVVGSRQESYEFLRAILERQQQGAPLSEADQESLALYKVGISDRDGVMYLLDGGGTFCQHLNSVSRKQGPGGTFFVKAPAQLD